MVNRSTTPARGGVRRGIARVLLALGATLFTATLAELGLRWWWRGVVAELGTRETHGGSHDARTVLCVGDSYTFGLYYRGEESYPARLEEMLNAGSSSDESTWRVVNVGVPAQNTAQILHALPEQLARHRPEIVVVLAGHNDRWNVVDPLQRSRLRNAIDSLVLVKLWRIATTDFEGFAGDEGRVARITRWSPEEVGVDSGTGEQVIEIDKTLDRRDDAAVRELCRQHFVLMAEAVRTAGAKTVLCSYPSPEPGYQAVAEAVDAAARSGGEDVLAVDAREVFVEMLESRPYHELLIPGDRHPTDRGYFHLARCIVESMADADWIGLGSEVESLGEARWPVTLELVAANADASVSGEAEALVGHGPPNAEYQLVVARSSDPPQHFGAKRVPIADDDLHRKFRDDPMLRGQFDSEGRAQLEFSDLPVDLRENGGVVALVVFYDLRLALPDLMVRGVSEAVTVSAPTNQPE